MCARARAQLYVCMCVHAFAEQHRLQIHSFESRQKGLKYSIYTGVQDFNIRNWPTLCVWHAQASAFQIHSFEPPYLTCAVHDVFVGLANSIFTKSNLWLCGYIYGKKGLSTVYIRVYRISICGIGQPYVFGMLKPVHSSFFSGSFSQLM